MQRGTTLNWVLSNRRLAIGLAGAVLLVGQTSPVLAISCGDTLSGGSHTLAADLDCTATGGTALSLNAAELDLDGHTISCAATANLQCVRLNGSSELHNGTVTGGGLTVFVRVNGDYVHDVTVLNSAGGGISLRSSADNARIINNFVSHSVIGISVAYNGTDPIGHEIAGNTVTHSSGRGINVGSLNNRISGNTANHNAATGIYINRAGNVVEGNTANRNAGSGIEVAGSVEVDVIGNTTNRNDGDGIFVSSSGADADLSENVAFRNGDDGIDNRGSGDCPTSGSDRNKAKRNKDKNFIGCP